jgi:RNA-directed DNA polymerase
MEAKSTQVPGYPDIQVEEIRARWAWVEPSVWSERMLAALERGVRGGKWFSLMDKVYTMPNLRAAWNNVRANYGAAGVDRQTIEQFGREEEKYLQVLQDELKEDRYQPHPARRQWIPKPGSKEMRPLGIPAVRDRVVQTALRNVLEPIFERKFAPQSYGFRPGRGCKDALRRMVALLQSGHRWVVDADIKGYFDSIPHERLMEEVEREVADGRVLKLLRKYLKAGVMEGIEFTEPEEGTPQGAVISPLLANLYLDALDHLMAQEGFQMIRYADDFVILCRSREEAERALEKVKAFMEERELTLHPTKTRLVDAMQKGGFDFLGYHFEPQYRWPRKKSLDKFKDNIRAKTRRSNGRSLECIIANVNPTVRGWYEYFKHSYRTTFPYLDGWIRMRLRSILRKRAGRQGRGRGADHQRWPNSYFDALGLFSMTTARRALCQSR